MKKLIPMTIGLSLLFSGSALAATPNATANSAVTAQSAASSKIACGDYIVNFDQASLASNSYLQNLLGLTKNEILSRLNSGKTPRDIAEDEGVDADKLIEALLRAPGNKMSADLKSGKLTQTKYNEARSELKQKLQTAIAQKAPALTANKGTAAPASSSAKTASAKTASAKTAVTHTSASTSQTASNHKLNQAAYLLGLSKAEIQKQTEAGKSIVQIAKEKGVDPDKVVNGVVYAEKQWIAQQLQKPWSGTNGSTSDEQQQFKANGYLTKAASLLGISEANLLKQLQSGKTIEQLCKAKGVNLSKVTSSLVTLAQQHIKSEANTKGENFA